MTVFYLWALSLNVIGKFMKHQKANTNDLTTRLGNYKCRMQTFLHTFAAIGGDF